MLSSIGVVKKVFFNKIIIEIDDIKRLNQNYRGEIYSCDGLDTFIILEKSYDEKLIYQISALYDEEKPIEKEENSKFKVKAFFEAVPIGSIIKEKFEYGIERYPMLGDEIYLVSKEILNKILGNDLKINQNNKFIIGELSNKKGFYPQIDIDKFFTTHISILGNTGSGKSTTIKTIIKKLSDKIEKNLKKENINFYIFDIHNEYVNIKEEISNKISLDEISIPLKLLKQEDWLNLVIPSTAVQLPILINTLKLGNLLERESSNDVFNWIKVYCAKKLYGSQQTDAVTKRSKIINFLNEIDDEEIKNSMSRYDSKFGNFEKEEEKRFLDSLNKYISKNIGENNPEEYLYENLKNSESSIKDIRTLKIALDTILLIEESKGGNQIRNYCSPLVTRVDNLINQYSSTLFSNDEEKLRKFKLLLDHKNKAFEVINCSGYDNQDLLFITSFILNNIYEREKNNRKEGKRNLIHFIFDEAHTYISENIEITTFNPLKIFEKIAKEGRKFGLFMILSSQRPSELSKTVLSQCNNFILHRIRNNIDLEQMRKSIPYISDSQLLRLSYLKTGHALVVGKGFNIQLELKIYNDIKDKSSETFKPSQVWK